MALILIVGFVLLLGLFNPWTGLFGDTLYSPRKKADVEIKNLAHKSFKLTKED